jgi:hypothetical protein
MELLTWVTEDLSYAHDMDLAATHAVVRLVTVASIEAIPDETVLVVWSPNQYDEDDFLAIEKRCKRIITLVPRSKHHTRLCPIRGHVSPRWYIVLPFDPEEAGVIIRGAINRSKQQQSEL